MESVKINGVNEMLKLLKSFRTHCLAGIKPIELNESGLKTAADVADRLNRDKEYPRVEKSVIYALALLDYAYRSIVELYEEYATHDIYRQLVEQLVDDYGYHSVHSVFAEFSDYFLSEPIQNEGPRHLEDFVAIVPHMIVNWLENTNPALNSLRILFDYRSMPSATLFETMMRTTEIFFRRDDILRYNETSLIDYLGFPSRVFPESLEGQLKFISDSWNLKGAGYSNLLLGLDFLNEEHKVRLPGPGPVIPLDFKIDDGSYPEEEELEQFSEDTHWMPEVVLMAKNVYVWLAQLSKKYSRPVNTLADIPDSELEELSRAGFSCLWLIGVWERSRASREIKVACGNPEAASSAYSLYSYTIAERLGGNDSFYNLKNRALNYGLRLGADMVPNHMGIDSPWVIDHPERFINLDESPFPVYSFSGMNLSGSDNVSIFLEDHYYSRSDAAVVFKHVNNTTGKESFIYHGNDGTHMPWNDTAQLNYLRDDVREAVIQEILNVAEKFPVIRFDAAMTLAKRHFKRLWYPSPGEGGDIPSRAGKGMTQKEFDALIPVEFWREVVERIGRELPDTLLLAEAFWLMEGYFVRTLGMHRVYNSAFMNMIKNEDNEKYRESIKNVLDFDPEILQRFVNFLSNPDEETAVGQFGKDDKYFGACVMLATLPGLPMFGHGQIEGFTEKYGMEYTRPYYNEQPDGYLIERHQSEIYPLLRKRYLFAGSENFRLYDMVNGKGLVQENVFAYTNSANSIHTLVLFNNRYEEAEGWISQSAPFTRKQNGDRIEGCIEHLSNVLKIPDLEHTYMKITDSITGLHHLYNCREIHEKGLFAHLGAFKYRVFIDREILTDHDGTLGVYYTEKRNAGVENFDKTLHYLKFGHIYAEFRKTLSGLYSIISSVNGSDIPEFEWNIVEEGLYALRKKISSPGIRELTDSIIVSGITEIRCFLKDRKRSAQAQQKSTGLDKKDQLLVAYGIFFHLLSLIEESGEKEIGFFRFQDILEDVFRDSALIEGDGKYEVFQVIALADKRELYKKTLSDIAEGDFFFKDELMSRIVCVHEHEGDQYFNKEAFENMVKLFSRICLCDLQQYSSKKVEKKAACCHKIAHHLLTLAEQSAYKVDAFIQLLHLKCKM